MKKVEIYGQRLLLIAFAFSAIVVAMVAIAVNFDLEFTRSLNQKSMWLGSILWVAFVASGWGLKLFKSKYVPTWPMIGLTALAVVSVAGLLDKNFVILARPVNAAGWSLNAIVAIVALELHWKRGIFGSNN